MEKINTSHQHCASSFSISGELTEREWEGLAGVLVADLWDWLEGGGQRGAVLFLGGRGGPLRLERGAW